MICLYRTGGHGLDRDAARPGPAIEFFAGDGVIASLFSTAISCA